MNLEVSEVQITPLTRSEKSLVAFASCTLNNQIRLSGIAVHSDLQNGGFRCVYPSKKLKNGKNQGLYYPINKITGEAIQSAIVTEWEALLAQMYS